MRITLKATIAMVGCLVLPGVVAAQGNAAEGENVFKKCKVCHDVGEGAKNKVGPILNDVVGRKAQVSKGIPILATLRRSVRRDSCGLKRTSASTSRT